MTYEECEASLGCVVLMDTSLCVIYEVRDKGDVWPIRVRFIATDMKLDMSNVFAHDPEELKFFGRMDNKMLNLIFG